MFIRKEPRGREGEEVEEEVEPQHRLTEAWPIYSARVRIVPWWAKVVRPYYPAMISHRMFATSEMAFQWMKRFSAAEANPEESKDRKLFIDCIPSREFFLQESSDWCTSITITNIIQQRKSITQFNEITNERS